MVETNGLRSMASGELEHRIANREDIVGITALMNAAISELQKPFLDEAQIQSSRAIMGLDTQLIDDDTYFVVTRAGVLAGCGGWSRRATMYGGDQSPGRNSALLDPAKDAARIRAMYTHPDFVRRGIGRLILSLCEGAAKAEGFARAGAWCHQGGRAFVPHLWLSTHPTILRRSARCTSPGFDDG